MQASTPGAPTSADMPVASSCNTGQVPSMLLVQSMGPPAAHVKIKQSAGAIEGDLELRICKDSDFNQHSQFQPEHAGSFPFECYCGHIFHNQKNYRAHILDDSCVQWKDVKIRDNLIVCTCGVQFAQRGSLFRHLRTRQCRAYWPDGGRALVCLCGAKFNRRDNMMRHQKSPRCRQNCNRLGVTGNPKDVLPPTMRRVYPRIYQSQARNTETNKSMGDKEASDEEWVINAKWKARFGTSPLEPTLSLKHLSPSYYSGPPTPVDGTSPVNSINGYSPLPSGQSPNSQINTSMVQSLVLPIPSFDRLAPIAHRSDTIEDKFGRAASPASLDAPAPTLPHLKSTQKQLCTALNLLFPEIVDLMDRLKVPAPVELARLVVETIDSIVMGFSTDGSVPQKNAGLMCQTISTGVAQILLAKLRAVTDETFVRAVHQMDAVVYSRLWQALKSIVTTS